MRRLVWLALLVPLAVGCSNAPLAGTLDCLMPARGTRPPADLPRPTDRDPLPPVPGFDPTPTDDGFRRDPIIPRDRGTSPLPRIGDPVVPDSPRSGGAMPLPVGGGY